MEENNLPEQITEDQLETVALEQEEKESEPVDGKKCNKCVFLTVLGLVFLIAMLVLYVWNLYNLQLSNEMQRILDNFEVNVPEASETTEKPDSEKTDGELLEELSEEVETDFDSMEKDFDQMDTELEELENATLTE
jgi:cytoskeletal protein RodZ